jgi:hypothetical protein
MGSKRFERYLRKRRDEQRRQRAAAAASSANMAPITSWFPAWDTSGMAAYNKKRRTATRE